MRTSIVNAEVLASVFRGGNKIRPLILILGASLTIDPAMPQLLFLDPGAADRTLLLPLAGATYKGLYFTIVNSGTTAYSLNVKDSTGVTTYTSVGRGDLATVYCDGSAWYAKGSQAATDLLGFYGATPVVQASGIDQGAFTDNSAGTKSLTIPVSVAYQVVPIYVLASGLANAQEHQFDPGFAGSLMAINARCTAAVTTGAKAATITGRVNAGALGGGGVISLSGTYAVGAAQAGTAVTGAKAFTAAQTVGFTVGSVTAFVEGAFTIELTLRNDDLNNYIAQQAASWNAARTALVNLGLIKGAA